MNLETTYLGLKLKNPIVIGSCAGLTDKLEQVLELEKSGASAIVLKSIFEEQILKYQNKVIEHNLPLEYINMYSDDNVIPNKLKYIQTLKKETSIPIIASVNCISSSDWIPFIKEYENAGADAIEINIFATPNHAFTRDEEITNLFSEISSKAKASTSLPISIKISPYFNNLSGLVETINKSDIDGITMFNRFFNPDIDTINMEIISGNIFTSPLDSGEALKWIGFSRNKVKADLAASSGIHSGLSIFKHLLVGANVVHVVSSIIQNGPEYIEEMLKDLTNNIEHIGFDSVSKIRGIMALDPNVNIADWERIHFMKYYNDVFKLKKRYSKFGIALFY